MTSVPRNSSPAAETSPTIVSIRGSPAATNEPNASSRIPSVTGQEITSDLSIALRLAALKSDHIPEAPVRCTCTPAAESAASLPFTSSAALTIPLELLAAPASTIAVCPSRLIEIPAEGAITLLTAGSALSVRSTFVSTAWNTGSLTVLVGEYSTVISA
jgi:hypothetical protein